MKRNPIDHPDQFVEVVCAATGEKFFKYKGEYNRQIKEGITRFFKDSKTAGVFLGAEKRAQKMIEKTCPQCQKVFSSTTKARASTYCSRECAAKHSYELCAQDADWKASRETKVSIAVKKRWEQIERGSVPRPKVANGKVMATPEERTRKCSECDNTFVLKFHASKQKTCSPICLKVRQRRTARENPNCGGETNYKRYVYNDITMDSAWEVEIAQWMDAHQVKWTRSRKMMFHWTDETGAKRRYYPDFYLPDYNVYLDPKNKYLIEKDRFKILAAQRENGITIIWGLRETLFVYLEALIKPV